MFPSDAPYMNIPGHPMIFRFLRWWYRLYLFFHGNNEPPYFEWWSPNFAQKRCQQKSPNFRKRYPSLSHPFPPFWAREKPLFFVLPVRGPRGPGGPGLRHYHWTPTSRLGSTTCRDIEWPGWSHPLAGWYTSHEEKICQNREKNAAKEPNCQS